MGFTFHNLCLHQSNWFMFVFGLFLFDMLLLEIQIKPKSFKINQNHRI